MCIEDSLYARSYNDIWKNKQDIVATHYVGEAGELKVWKQKSKDQRIVTKPALF